MPTVATDRKLTVVRWPCGCALTISPEMDNPSAASATPPAANATPP